MTESNLLQADLRVELFDALGRSVFVQTAAVVSFPGEEQFNLPAGVSAGTYTLLVTIGDRPAQKTTLVVR